ncbi:hypothetical protein N665_0032s0014 [Sinapis alba]|nr:hypothetical protein N665_0032s0014 [Sinapis alba]
MKIYITLFTHVYIPFLEDSRKKRDHLLFACPFTFTIWLRIVSNLFVTDPDPDPDWDTTLMHLMMGAFDTLTFILLRLVSQITIYFIWWEYNDRRKNGGTKSVDQLARVIDKTVKNIITSLKYNSKPKLQGLMRRWFSAH